MPSQLSMKRIIAIVFILGLVLLCGFCTPIKYHEYRSGSDMYYTNIFSNKGDIIVGRFLLYIFIWTLLCFSAFLGFTHSKPKN